MNISLRPHFKTIACALFAGAFALPVTQANFALLDDFQSYPTGNLNSITTDWAPHGGSGFSTIQEDGPNKFLAYGWDQFFRGASRPLDGAEIGPGDTATVFLQFRAGPFASGWSDGGGQFGLAHNPDTEANNDFNDYRVQATVNPSPELNVHNLVLRDGDDFGTVATLQNGAWYNAWIVIDRTDGDTFQIYLTGGADIDATEGDLLSYENGEGETISTFSFRSGGSEEDVLDAFMVLGLTDPNRGMVIDNIWIDNTGKNLSFQGSDFLGWQVDYTPLSSPVSLEFGTAGGRSDESDLLRNRSQDFTLQQSALRYVPTSTSFTSSVALSEVEDYQERQDFTVEVDLILNNFIEEGGMRAGVVVLGDHVPFDNPFNTSVDREFYSLVWFPAIAEEDSRLQISEGLNGPVFESVVWEGLHPYMTDESSASGIDDSAGVNTSTPFELKAEGVYNDAGDLTLSMTLTDPEGFSQTVSTEVVNPYTGRFFGLGTRSQKTEFVQADPRVDFHNLNVALGDEPGEIIPDPSVEAPFELAFGSEEGLDDGSDFSRSAPEDWSLEATTLQLSATTADYRNSIATSRVSSFSPGTDFFLRSQITVSSLSASEADNRVGMVLFGNTERSTFDAADDDSFLTLQWLPTSPDGGSLVVRQGMDGEEIGRTDFSDSEEAPVFASGGTYHLYFEGRYDGEGDLQFEAYLLDESQNEIGLEGVIENPPSGNRFGFGARHRTAENAVWDFDAFDWSVAPVLRGQVITIAATPGSDPDGGTANTIGQRRADNEFVWFSNSIVGTNGGDAERATNVTFFLFELPERQEGVSVRSANLSFTRDDRNRDPGEANVDVWGVGYQGDGVLSSDLWHAGDTDESSGVGIPEPIKLHDDIVTPDTPSSQALFTTEGADFELVDYLNHLYDHGAQAGDYAIIRLSYDIDELDLPVVRYEFFRPGSANGPEVNMTMTAAPAPEGLVFADWKLNEFDPEDRDVEEISGLLATPAGDGVSNLVKYATGISPWTRATQEDVFVFTREGDVLSLSYNERTNATDLEFVVEVSEDLVEWNSGSEYTTEIRGEDVGEFQPVTVEALSTDVDRHFMRLKVRKLD